MLPTTKDLDIARCPFGAKNKDVMVCPRDLQSKEVTAVLNDVSKPKVKKQKGGCPVMTSEKKRNPPLEIMTEGYNIIYQSHYEYLLSHQGFLFTSPLDAPQVPLNEQRLKFDSYPIYLKHTIFHEEPEMLKIRNLETSQRFFAYDQFRESGNKAYHKKSYQIALRHYERAMSCYQWLEVLDEDAVERQKIITKLAKEEVQSQHEDDQLSNSSANAGSIPDPDGVDEEPQDEFIEEAVPVHMIEVVTVEESKVQNDRLGDDYVDHQQQQQKKIRKKYKTLLTVFTDENVVFHGQENNLDLHDKDMRDSLLFSIYLNMAATYMKLNHFELARTVLQDAMKIKKDNSLVLFRMTQAIVFDKCSTIQELESAINLINSALLLQPSEKVFKQEAPLLQMMNFHNVPHIYQELLKFTQQRLDSRVGWERDSFNDLFEQEKELEDIEREIRESGRIPDDINGGAHDHQEYDIVREMMKKYYQIIDYHTESQRYDQVDIAQEQLQNLSQVYHKMKFFVSLDFTHCEENKIMTEVRQKYDVDLGNHNILCRLKRLCSEKVRDLFEEGQYNYQLYQIALKDYFKKRSVKKQSEKTHQVDQKNSLSRMLTQACTKDFGLQIIFVVVLLLLTVYFGGLKQLNKYINLQY